jgi:hemerythrin-like domain-containing protein
VLYPLAEDNLSSEKQPELAKEFEKIETEKIGAGKHEEFHALLEQLEEIYLSDQMNRVDSVRRFEK